jgi:3-demethoxyubiquinol 3-hydroxylase
VTEATATNTSRIPPSKRTIDAMIRVNHAGEYGAKRIYAGQLSVLPKGSASARAVAHMAEQEERHLAHFDALITARGVRPSLLHPIWHKAGFALGAVTAALGPEAAMACTVAVETEIDRHYAEQLEILGDSDPALSAAIVDFQADEVAHKAEALASGAETAPAYPLLTAVIRMGCRLAIGAAKKI